MSDIKVNTSDFLQKFRIVNCYKTVTERYYTPELYVNPLSNQYSNQDSMILRHSNKLRLTTLSPDHDILKKDLKVIKVDFETGKKNRMDNKTKGKWKRGAQKLEEQSIICIIECENGQSFKIRSGVKGNLIEVNKRLIEKPELVKEFTWSDGYIAAILPPLQTGDRFISNKNVEVENESNEKKNEEQLKENGKLLEKESINNDKDEQPEYKKIKIQKIE